VDRSRVTLASEMRQIQNLSILTPLQKSTRDRIVAELQPLARRVKQLRLQMKKLECEREVLDSDLISFEAEIRGALLQPVRPSNETLSPHVQHRERSIDCGPEANGIIHS